MSFEPFHGVENNPNRTDAPQLAVHPSRKAYLNATADIRHYEDAEKVVYLVDAATNRVAIAPADDRDGRQYTLRRRTEHGANVSFGGVLQRLDIDVSALESARQLPLEWDADLGAGVVDLSPLADGNETPDSDDDEDAVAGDEEDEADEQVACDAPDCEDTFDTEHGMRIHHGRVHDSSDASDASASENGEVPLLTRQAESFVADKGIRTLTGLADALDVSAGQARKHARQADVYSSLTDDAVSRPGVSD